MKKIPDAHVYSDRLNSRIVTLMQYVLASGMATRYAFSSSEALKLLMCGRNYPCLHLDIVRARWRLSSRYVPPSPSILRPCSLFETTTTDTLKMVLIDTLYLVCITSQHTRFPWHRIPSNEASVSQISLCAFCHLRSLLVYINSFIAM